jgi:type I restriction enzyme S subunit
MQPVMAEVVRLGEILSRESDEVLLSPTESYATAGILSYGRGLFKRPVVLGSETSYKHYYRLHEGQFVYSKLFAWEGALAVVDSRFDGCFVSQEFPTFSIDRSRAEPAYLGLLCQWPVFWQLVGSGQTGMGGRRKRVHPEFLLTIELLLPDIEEQRRVVHLLEAAEAVIARAEEAMRCAASAYGALAESEIMQTNAEPEPVGSFASVNPKVSPLSSDAPFYPMNSIQVWAREPAYSEPRGERSGARAQAGDVLFARITPCLENGKTAMVPKDVELCGGSTELIVLRAKEGVDPRYLYCWATVPSIRAMAAALMTGTTGRQRLSPRDLASLPFPMRDLEEQEAVVDLLFAGQDVVTRSSQVVETATRARGALLADLMPGRHEIGPSYDIVRLR